MLAFIKWVLGGFRSKPEPSYRVLRSEVIVTNPEAEPMLVPLVNPLAQSENHPKVEVDPKDEEPLTSEQESSLNDMAGDL